MTFVFYFRSQATDIIQSHMSHSVWIPSWTFYSSPTLDWSLSFYLEPIPSSQFLKIYKSKSARTALLLHLRKLVFTPSMWCVIVSVIPPSTTTSCQVSVGQKPDTHTCLPSFCSYLLLVTELAWRMVEVRRTKKYRDANMPVTLHY